MLPDNLRERIAALVTARPQPPITIEWQGTTYRFASRKYAGREHFTDGEGARRFGGRFTPKGGPRTLYLALDRVTAMAELDSWFRYYNVPDSAFQPRVLAAVAVSVGLLLDLSSTRALDALGLDGGVLAEEWRADSETGGIASVQDLGRMVYESGFEGILYSSARRESGLNLALFPDNFHQGSHALMIDHE